jgi:hypothetical protein
MKNLGAFHFFAQTSSVGTGVEGGRRRKGAGRDGAAGATRALLDLPEPAANHASAVLAGPGTAGGSFRLGRGRCFPSRAMGGQHV